MAKGRMLGLPGPDDPMFREGWSIGFVGGPWKQGVVREEEGSIAPERPTTAGAEVGQESSEAGEGKRGGE